MSEDLKQHIWQKTAAESSNVLCPGQSGASYMLLNGQFVDIASMDLFKVLLPA